MAICKYSWLCEYSELWSHRGLRVGASSYYSIEGFMLALGKFWGDSDFSIIIMKNSALVEMGKTYKVTKAIKKIENVTQG